MNPTIYIETSIIGYLSSRPSRDLITAANQQMTHDWWHNHRGKYDMSCTFQKPLSTSAARVIRWQLRSDWIFLREFH